jgi:CxxC motif-containing protein (DUF1111 family)
MVRTILGFTPRFWVPHGARRRRAGIPVLLLAASLVLGCDDPQSPAAEDVFAHRNRGKSTPAVPGDVLPGTDLDVFAEAADAFGELETIDDGLGPIFNDRGCGACHSIPVTGGSGSQIERRFGRMDNGVFYGYDADHGGTLRQLFSNGTYTNPENGQVCEIPVEEEPQDATVNDVGRRTPPLFGLGLVDAMPDEFFEKLARRQPRSVRGVVSYVPVALPDPRDRHQSVGSLRVARFGWKGNVPSLLQFAGDAYTNEMGVTTQSCFEGKTILDFALENFPNNVPPESGCNGGDLAPLQPAHADVPEFTDDAVGPCDGNLTEIQDDLLLFTMFMESLAPLPSDVSLKSPYDRGEYLFTEIGCADCHVTTTFVTPRRPFNGVPGRYRFNPYSDFLLHDMGSLGDGIGATGDSEAETRLMRTQPLWGARYNTQFLHDGRAPDIESAIQAHDGQGARARRRFDRLRWREQRALIEYVLSL